jgi:hypothetical protein
MPVATLCRRTVAPGITAPDESVTVPLIAAVAPWAKHGFDELAKVKIKRRSATPAFISRDHPNEDTCSYLFHNFMTTSLHVHSLHGLLTPRHDHFKRAMKRLPQFLDIAVPRYYYLFRDYRLPRRKKGAKLCSSLSRRDCFEFSTIPELLGDPSVS